ncbi:MAG: DUF2207 domain-containing protein [Alphaproteobacteria bacterium]|nr:DUF2207 domain-containing protein [Alphaproteobacteria bacterium]
MKKLFLAICFTLCLSVSHNLSAAVSSIEEAAQEASTPKPLAPMSSEGLPDPKNVDEVRAFFKQRFQTAVVSDAAELGDLNKSNAMDVQHSAEYIQNMQEQKKSAFEKIYDQMLDRLNAPQVEFSPDTVFYEQFKQQSPRSTENVDVSVVRVRLPNGSVVLAPAREHIPYLLSSFHILPTGLIEVEEEVVVVANGEKLKSGLVKTMPKYTTSRDNVKKKVDIDLLSVSLNGAPIGYKLQEIGNTILFAPKEKYELEPGVYTYRFNYLLDRKLWYYDDFTEFYTDISSSYPNLVIGSANAIVSIPDGRNFMTSLAMSGAPDNLAAGRTVVAHLSQNAIGFASLIPLASDEGMHILVSLDKVIFNAPSLSQRFVWFITDYGDILFSFLGFAVIFISYFFSWKYIKQNKSRLTVRFKQTAPLNRYILKGVYDMRSFVSAFLDLVRYHVIDIKKEGKTLMLVKKTDSLKNLPLGLKQIVRSLFGKTETSVELSAKNKLKFARAFKKHESDIKTYFKVLTWRLNIWYLLFGTSMFALTLLSIAYIAINPLETMLILISAVITLAFYLWILGHPFSKKWVRLSVEVTAGVFVLLTVFMLGVYIHLLSAFLLAATVYVILEYSKRFSAKNGLIKSKEQELERLYQYLSTNVSTISKSKEFEMEQANIFAFELEDKYEENSKNQKAYQLDVARELLKALQ